jgi:hypothetical protein
LPQQLGNHHLCQRECSKANGLFVDTHLIDLRNIGS